MLPSYYCFNTSSNHKNQGLLWFLMFRTHVGTILGSQSFMGFRTRTTTPHGLSEGQRRFMLAQTMDLNTIVWHVGLCLAMQRHHGDQLLSLRQRILVRGHHGPHPWRELKAWSDKSITSLDLSNMWWRKSELNMFTLLWFFRLPWWLHHHILVVMKKCQIPVLAPTLGAWLMFVPFSSSLSPCQHQVVIIWWRGWLQSLMLGQ